jgi:hypothetical protein
MTEAEFERQQGLGMTDAVVAEPEPMGRVTAPAQSSSRTRGGRGRAVKPKRVQRMFALEEELDKKLWLYAIHVGKDRSEVINDLLRPLVASMVLYDSRDRRAARAIDPGPDGDGASVEDSGR